jgi:transposase
MRKIKQVLRLHHESHLSIRQIRKSLGIGQGTVQDYLDRAQRAGIGWPLAPELDEAALEQRLFPVANPVPTGEKPPMPPMEEIHRELRKKGVTLLLLWHEYKEKVPEGYQYSQFCHLYRQWTKKLDPRLRQEHRAGEKLFVDYAGPTVEIITQETGEIREAQIFVATLGASNYTYAEASLSQELPCWIQSHIHAFEFFGGTPEILVPDNLKSGVIRPCRYEPDLNATYREMAEHYGAVIIPARIKKPKDKPKVEAGVLNVERWVLAPLRHHTFFSLTELNEAIREKLRLLNLRLFEELEGSRKSLFESLDRPALKPLPAHRYDYADWEYPKANIDYHIEVDHHYYSVPYQLIKQQVDIRLTQTTVEVLFKNQRVASHVRSYQKGKFTTLKQHLSKSHQAYLEWTPSRIIRWASKHGPHTERLITLILETRLHPHHGFRSCLGILRLAKSYSPERLEAACACALHIKGYSYKSVESILKTGLDQKKGWLEPSPPLIKPIAHLNIRGKQYYQ